jgi:integrase
VLTDVSVRKAAPTTKRQEIADAQAPGLYLIVQPSGSKSWAVRYSRGGKVKKVTLGGYPALPLVEARRRALGIAAGVANGADPAEEKKAERKAAARRPDAVQTVRTMADEFLKRHTDEKNGARWAAETKRMLDHDVLPVIGDRLAAAVNKAEIHAVLDTISDRGAPVAANRTLAVMRKLFAWAVSRGYVDRNPCEGVAKPGEETKRDRVLSDDELALVWRAAEGMAYPFGSAIRLLFLTAARRDEVGSMTFAEVDFRANVWTLPAERSKNGLGHVIPLSGAALSIIESIPRIGKRDGFVFTTTGETAVSGWSKAKATLDAASGIADWRLHDIRRTAASGMAALGISLPVVEKILNHTSGSFGGVAGVYQRHDFAAEKRDALDKWAARVAVIVKASEEDAIG